MDRLKDIGLWILFLGMCLLPISMLLSFPGSPGYPYLTILLFLLSIVIPVFGFLLVVIDKRRRIQKYIESEETEIKV
ncbi:MAG: hypothetical protein ACFFC7_13935 [Candidatus Hermodarchaeota archaeon]